MTDPKKTLKTKVEKGLPIGSFTPIQVCLICMEFDSKKDGSSKWTPIRPLQYESIKERLKMAFDVFTYKADALYWR
jgi:hypothetical protein